MKSEQSKGHEPGDERSDRSHGERTQVCTDFTILFFGLSLTLAGCVTVIGHRLGPRSIQSEY